MKKLVLLIVASIGILGSSTAQSISISGPSTVCPKQEYRYKIDADFLLGQCTSQWAVFDETGALVKAGGGDEFTFVFEHPQNRKYTVRGIATGGIDCRSVVIANKTVTTRYPVPTITGPKYICAGGSGLLNVSVDASSICFHHKIDYLLPAGWTVTNTASGPMIGVSPTAENKKYTIKARVWYDDLNLYGDYVDWSVWIGPPGYTTSSPFVNDVNTNSTYVYTYSNSVHFYVPSGEGVSYYWTITADQACNSNYNGPYFYSYGSGTTQATTPTNMIYVSTGTCPGKFRINCYAVNACGTTQYSQRLFRVSSGSSGGGGGGGCEPTFTVYPNPSKAQDVVTINLVPPPPGGGCDNTLTSINAKSAVSLTADDVISGISIRNSLGYPVREERLSAQTQSHILNAADLKPGFYYLTIQTIQGRTFQTRIMRN